jgi:hypothetical protein
MGFAGTAFAQQDDVALVIDIITRCQLTHQAPVQTGSGFEFEAFQRFEQRELCLLESAFLALLGADTQLKLGQLQQKLAVVDPLVSGLTQVLLNMASHIGQVQGFEVVLHQHCIGGTAHDPPPSLA